MAQQATLAGPGGGASAGATPVAGAGAIRLPLYLAIVAQLALVLLLFRQYQIESGAFLRLAVLAFAGFAVHALLPLAWRLPFFLLLSVAGIFVAIDVANALWLIGCGLVLIGVAHLPAPFRVRVGLLVALGAALALMRARVVEGPMPEAIWPILGSMFMFRLITYMYDLRHEQAPPSPARTLSYFFLLPNVCFPLFPVVDFRTFRRSHYDDDAYRVYQLGIDWMVRGVIHLLAYRFVYYHLTLAPAEVVDPATLSQYLVSNFLLYLRVSGLFHLIIGMLCLFGFRLPETHNRYLLASSFTDFWRRINIYWKDFMQKVFYYPALFRLRRLGTTAAMVVATLFVFVLTWFLHAWQWFWLRGTTLLVAQDVLFWTFLGALVVVNALYEVRHGRRRRLGGGQTPREYAGLVARRYATFWAIAVLWSFWTSESIADWLALWPALRGPWSASALLYPAVVLAVIALGSVERGGVRNVKGAAQTPGEALRVRAVTVASMVALIVVGVESVHTRLGTEIATTVHSLRSGRLSRLDSAKLERGYYESLLSVDRFNSQLWEVYSKRPANWLDTQHAQLKRFTGDFAQVELIPSFVSNSNYGTISTNRWGMRDRDYALAPPPGTFRIALLGPSNVMGWGVGDGETFEALLEERLNASRPPGAAAVEILNFAVPGYQPMQQVVAADKAARFDPDALYYVATGRELARNAAYLIELVRKGREIPYPALRAVADEARLDADLEESEASRRLQPFRERLLAWTYGEIVATARRAGARPVLLFLPQARAGSWQDEVAQQNAIAREAGFEVISLQGVYDGHDIETLRVAEWDEHPNRLAHRLIAERLHAALAGAPALVGRAQPAAASPPSGGR
ncbi:MAG: hypothetical protein KJ018_02585 [Burkholderiales bacterium]|nr:hypothetical protein [Burkholderiales bacterium]